MPGFSLGLLAKINIPVSQALLALSSSVISFDLIRSDWEKGKSFYCLDIWISRIINDSKRYSQNQTPEIEIQNFRKILDDWLLETRYKFPRESEMQAMEALLCGELAYRLNKKNEKTARGILDFPVFISEVVGCFKKMCNVTNLDLLLSQEVVVNGTPKVAYKEILSKCSFEKMTSLIFEFGPL